jgi:cell division septation protein DedD
MKNKDFREIQVSSSLLVVIFLGVLALGVFIFLLGVSVGKKQVGIASQTQIVAQQIPEPVKEVPVQPAPSDTDPAKAGTPPGAGQPPASAGSAASKPPVKETTSAPAAEKTGSETKKTPAAGTGLYYVQVGAFADRAQARALADRYKKQGYTAVVADPRPTDTKTQYRVRLGGYSSRDRAVDLLKKVNAAAGRKTDFYVVRD